MLRRCVCRCTLSLRDMAERLDSFERSMIELQAFRKAVERTSPSVAAAAKLLIPNEVREVRINKELLANPITADEFAELNGFYAVQKCKDVNLQGWLHVSNIDSLIHRASATYREFLVRIARRVQDLTTAPYGLSQMPSILELKRWYQWSFHDMRNIASPSDRQSCIEFDHCIRRIFLRHYDVSVLLSEGLLELARREQWRRADASLRTSYHELEEFFTTFISGRVRLRFLLGNYMNLSNAILNVDWEAVRAYDTDGKTATQDFGLDRTQFAGLLCKTCSLRQLTEWAVRAAQVANPELEFHLRVVGDEEDLTCVSVPSLIVDLLTALLNDAVECNLQRQEKIGAACTPINITLVQRAGCSRISLCVADSAGGVPLDDVAQLLSCWSVFRDLDAPPCTTSKVKTWTQSPIRLPYALTAARVFGGDLRVASIEGYGTRRYLYLPANGVADLAI